jgi:hypothetical protein
MLSLTHFVKFRSERNQVYLGSEIPKIHGLQCNYIYLR